MATLTPCTDLAATCAELGIEPLDADPARNCPICEKRNREHVWLAQKAVAEEFPDGSKETTVLLQCSNELCLFTTFLRRGTDAPIAPAPTVEEV